MTKLRAGPAIPFISPHKTGRAQEKFPPLGQPPIVYIGEPSSYANRPNLLGLTADFADHADKGNISAISEIRGQNAWEAFSEKYKR